ncbi:hypothetical protein QLH51_01095 [Sphingomonas sp. 2R-10]|jgi:hypothetical protein|uniref:hypothetical protein n=1 Tax=Sphingomonas sp. 2R-10 TaxID=3045148 RepID=UPI000F78111B|nr:hypothetical protein [Sphingomonas sp. 2R-10]MDJ0275403.1 hypothetical protein [Sphingomonas sp. 2R-10]
MNDRKIISIILEEAQSLPERCDGYREEVVAAISDVLENERQHRVAGTNIQQKINEKCNAVGRYLAERRAVSGGDKA